MIKAIETVYNGYRFRSRLEARWAVFLDTLKIEYEYEPEGFDLGNDIWYLPDFWLPDLKLWIEIKGIEPDYAEQTKAVLLAQQSKIGVNVAIFWPHFDKKSQSNAMIFYKDRNGIFHSHSNWEIQEILLGWWGWDDHELQSAYTAARQARFERGAR